MAGVPKPFQQNVSQLVKDCRLTSFVVFLILLRGAYTNPFNKSLRALFRIVVFRFAQNVFLLLLRGAYPNPFNKMLRISFRTVDSLCSSSSLYFSEGLSQTLSTIPLCGIVGFFASHLLTKASF